MVLVFFNIRERNEAWTTCVFFIMYIWSNINKQFLSDIFSEFYEAINLGGNKVKMNLCLYFRTSIFDIRLFFKNHYLCLPLTNYRSLNKALSWKRAIYFT